MRKLSCIVFSMVVATSINAAAASLKIGGGAAPINNVFKKVAGPLKSATGIELNLEEVGPDNALLALDNGTLDAASGGLSWGDWLALMKEKNITLKTAPDAFKVRVVGFDRIAVAVHPAVSVGELSADQLKGLFTGAIKNWKAVGGPDIPVVVVFGEKIAGTNKHFQKMIMKGESFAADTSKTGTAPEVIEKIKATPGAIGLAPMGIVLDGVKTPKTPEIGRPISVVTKGAPSAEMQKVFEFIAGEGKKYLPK